MFNNIIFPYPNNISDSSEWTKFHKLFTSDRKWRPRVIGMIHLAALPGCPAHKLTVPEICSKAIEEAKIYVAAGVDAVMIENMHDVPYTCQKVGPEITSVMTHVCTIVRQLIPPHMPVGVQVLAGANKEAIAVALASNLQFVRVEGFVYSHVADEGLMNSCAGELLRYRHAMNADHILVLADIKKKHSSHAITQDISVADTAKAAKFFLADGIIITGTSTGTKVKISDVKEALTSNLPVLLGSGVDLDIFEEGYSYINHISAFIIGSYFKTDGNWKSPVSLERTSNFIKALNMYLSKQKI